ncbi:short chain dehydrogenase family protein [Mycobacterium xenopi 3993]|nr:short chain dehydrogenase family protein [Mycobacterium xenopi 3993]
MNIRGVVHGVVAAYPVMLRQGHGHIVNTASMAGLTAAGQITSYVMSKHAVVGLSLALRSEAIPRGVGVLAVCPPPWRRRSWTRARSAGSSAATTTCAARASGAPTTPTGWPATRCARSSATRRCWSCRNARMPRGWSRGWHLVCCNGFRSGSSSGNAPARPLEQTLGEELHDPLAGLVGRVAVGLANLIGQHRMRHPGEAVFVAGPGVDLDHLERVAKAVLKRLKPVPRHQLVLAEP